MMKRYEQGISVETLRNWVKPLYMDDNYLTLKYHWIKLPQYHWIKLPHIGSRRWERGWRGRLGALPQLAWTHAHETIPCASKGFTVPLADHLHGGLAGG